MDVALLNLSIDEPAIKGLESKESDADFRKRYGSILCVEGYDTSLQPYLLELMLEKHFASCGELHHITVRRNPEKGILKRYSFIRIAGEGAREKALELSGSDVGGWNVVVKAAAEPLIKKKYKAATSFEKKYNWAAKFSQESCQNYRIVVKGFDTSLPKIDIQIALCKHFSSCGEITYIHVIKGAGLVVFR